MDEKQERHALAFEYDEITPDLFLGTTMCCQAHFQEELLDRGISIDISLQKEKIDSPIGVEMFTWIPVEDNTAPTQAQFDLGVSAITRAIEVGKKVYVHCKFGHGRGPTMVAAYLISMGKSLEDALKFIKEKRPVIHLNEDQMNALQVYQNRVQ